MLCKCVNEKTYKERKETVVFFFQGELVLEWDKTSDETEVVHFVSPYFVYKLIVHKLLDLLQCPKFLTIKGTCGLILFVRVKRKTSVLSLLSFCYSPKGGRHCRGPWRVDDEDESFRHHKLLKNLQYSSAQTQDCVCGGVRERVTSCLPLGWLSPSVRYRSDIFVTDGSDDTMPGI